MQDDEPDAGRRLRVKFSIGELEFAEPVLEPLIIGTMGHQAEAEDAGQMLRAMTVTLDIDSVPRLREAFERTSAGEGLDVISQWHASVPADPAESPLAFLFLRLPELDLAFRICFVVDESKKSLAAAARTGEVMLFSPELNAAIRVDPPYEALKKYPSLAVSVPDVEPLRRVLEQRFDMPLPPAPRQPKRTIEPGEFEAEFARFVSGTLPIRSVAIFVPPDELTVVAVVDPTVASAMANAGPVEERWAHWASMQAGPIAIARLDVLRGETRLAAWLIPNPDPALVRAASAGPHRVVVIASDLNPQDLVGEHLREGVEFRVETAPDSMRALLSPSASST